MSTLSYFLSIGVDDSLGSNSALQSVAASKTPQRERCIRTPETTATRNCDSDKFCTQSQQLGPEAEAAELVHLKPTVRRSPSPTDSPVKGQSELEVGSSWRSPQEQTTIERRVSDPARLAWGQPTKRGMSCRLGSGQLAPRLRVTPAPHSPSPLDPRRVAMSLRAQRASPRSAALSSPMTAHPQAAATSRQRHVANPHEWRHQDARVRASGNWSLARQRRGQTATWRQGASGH